MKLTIVFLVAVLPTLAKARDLSQYTHNNNYIQPNRVGVYNSRIVGGQEAEPHSLPHSVALYTKHNILLRSFCGGSIINASVILTAAHCVNSAKSVEVVAGVHNLNQNEESRQSRLSSTFIVHEKWDRDTLTNDIALVILADPLNLNENVKPIVVDNTDCKSTEHDGTEATSAGWGRPSDSSSSISPVLREVKNLILTNKKCDSYFGIIVDSHICLDGSGGKGGCNGDSGSALFNGDGVQLGIASFVGGGGCEYNFPTAYTRVSCFYDWIQSHLP